MKNIVDKVISAIRAAGIECEREYCRMSGYRREKGRCSSFAGIRKIRFERFRNGASDITVQLRVTVQGFDVDGQEVQDTAEKKIVPAVMNCGEEVFGAEISEVRYEPSTDRVSCEIFFEVKRGGYGV